MLKRMHLSSLLAVLLVTEATAGLPVVAVLDSGKSDRVPLLEAKLAALTGITLVERAAVDAVLKEQQLQAAFGPQGVGERVRLGKVLKADVLVMARGVKNAQPPAMEIVISETAAGLRLLHGSIAISADAAADAAELAGLVRAGLSKHAEKVVEIVAVPPFLSRDLTFEHDHLKDALARLAEQVVLDRPGVVVIELAEAETLAKELSLAAPGSRVERPLPLYLLGEFRHDGAAADKRMTLKLRAERGGKYVARSVESVVTPASAAEAVRRWANDAVAEAIGQPTPPADARTELLGLTRRAADFRRIAAWSETLALAEAALLLDPMQPELHGLAVMSISRVLHAPGRARDLETMRATQRLMQRGWGHFHALVDRTDGLAAYRKAFPSGVSHNFTSCLDLLRPFAQDEPGVKTSIAEIHKEAEEQLLQFVRLMARWGTYDGDEFILQVFHNKPTAERYALAERLILELKDQPGSQLRTRLCLVGARSGGIASFQGTPEVESAARHALFQRLEATRDRHIMAAVDEVRSKEAKEVSLPKSSEVPKGLALRPMTFKDGSGARVVNVEALGFAGHGIDYAWAGGTLYLSKSAGKLHRIWKSDDKLAHLLGVVHDGRYLWLIVRPTLAAPRVLIVDPVAETVQEATASAGLPQPGAEAARAQEMSVMLTPLAPGRVCLAGTYGRTWIAVAAIDASTKTVAVKVIHEAHEAPIFYDRNQAAKSTIEFRPTFLLAVRDARKESRVIVGRGISSLKASNFFARERPLVVDPDRGTVTVSERFEDILGMNIHRAFAQDGGEAYRIEPGPWLDEKVKRDRHEGWLVRVGSSLKQERLAAGMPTGNVSVGLVREGRYHFVSDTIAKPPEGKSNAIGALRIDREWWSVKLDGTDLRREATQLPKIVDLHSTSHHGVVASVSVPGPIFTDVRTVLFDPAP